ncbi:MAG: hypothetical protein ACREKL_14945 [Chthoniobacterales bacterium]
MNRIKSAVLVAAGVFVFLGSGTKANAQAVVGVDPTAPWQGYMNVFELPSNGGAYVFGQPWTPVDLTAVFTGDVLTLGPNSIGDTSAFWYTPSGGPGATGNKIMDANLYQETTNVYTGQNLTFTGNVLSNTFISGYTLTAFIKDFAPDYSSSIGTSTPLVDGVFSISFDILPLAGRHVQFGFTVNGPDVWVTDRAPVGEAQITAVPEPGLPGYAACATLLLGTSALLRRRKTRTA